MWTTRQQFLTLHELEQSYIDEVLTASGQNKTQAARILGMIRTARPLGRIRGPLSLIRTTRPEKPFVRISTAAFR